MTVSTSLPAPKAEFGKTTGLFVPGTMVTLPGSAIVGEAVVPTVVRAMTPATLKPAAPAAAGAARVNVSDRASPWPV